LQIELELKSIQNRLEFIKLIFGERGEPHKPKEGKEYNVFKQKKYETSQKFEHHARHRRLDKIF
jgi:hypothetical protein